MLQFGVCIGISWIGSVYWVVIQCFQYWVCLFGVVCYKVCICVNGVIECLYVVDQFFCVFQFVENFVVFEQVLKVCQCVDEVVDCGYGLVNLGLYVVEFVCYQVGFIGQFVDVVGVYSDLFGIFIQFVVDFVSLLGCLGLFQ